MTQTKRAIIWRIQAHRPDINKILLLSVFLIDSSSYKWATVTEEPPPTQPLIGFWISEERKGSSPFKPSQDKLQPLKWVRMSLYLQSVVSFLLHSCFPFCPSCVPFLHLPSLIQLILLFWCCLAAAASWGGTPDPNGQLRHWRQQDQPKPTNLKPADPWFCLSALSLPPSILLSFLSPVIYFLMSLNKWQPNFSSQTASKPPLLPRTSQSKSTENQIRREQ